MPWYAEEKARAGSFAAFIGVEIDVDAGSWQAVALGDSCLIQLRNSKIVEALPISDAAEFELSSVLAPSNTALQSEAAQKIVAKTGRLENGDRFLLLSDAGAAWFFQINENRRLNLLQHFMSLVSNGDEKSLANFLETERSAERLKDDDIAVIGIEVSRI